MKTKTPLRRILAPAAILLFAIAPLVAAPAPDRPNVILIVADDMGYADLSCQGARGFKTPNIDRMASEGTRFTSFYVAQAVCTASRAALTMRFESRSPGMPVSIRIDSPAGVTISVAAPPSTSTQYMSTPRSAAATEPKARQVQASRDFKTP